MSKKNRIRLYVPMPLETEEFIACDEDQAHYLCHVMRLGVGEEVYVFNGGAGEFRSVMVESGKKKCLLHLKEKICDFYPCPDIWLLFAPLKKDPMDFLVRKAVELGVSKLIPVLTQYTVTINLRLDKLKLQIIEAAEQCRRQDLPQISGAENLLKILDHWSGNRKLYYLDESGEGCPIKIAFAENCQTNNLKPMEKETTIDIAKAGSAQTPRMMSHNSKSNSGALLIGPEGGFAEKELEILRSLPYTVGVSLGKRILRAETAAVAALSCWQAMCGDWQ